MYSFFVFCPEDGDMICRNMKEDIVYKTVSKRLLCVFWYYYYIESTQIFPLTLGAVKWSASGSDRVTYGRCRFIDWIGS